MLLVMNNIVDSFLLLTIIVNSTVVITCFNGWRLEKDDVLGDY